MELKSDNFNNGESIPERFAYKNANTIPHLEWSDFPEETKSLALICNDPDAPVGNWIHWLVHSIPPTAEHIPEGGPVPGIELTNDYGKIGWGGPAPPSGTHRYFFTIYAVHCKLYNLGHQSDCTPRHGTGETLRGHRACQLTSYSHLSMGVYKDLHIHSKAHLRHVQFCPSSMQLLTTLDTERLEGIGKTNFRELCEEHRLASAELMGTYTHK